MRGENYLYCLQGRGVNPAQVGSGRTHLFRDSLNDILNELGQKDESQRRLVEQKGKWKMCALYEH